MNPQDIFKLAVRLLGLVFLYQGLQTLPGAVIQFFTILGTNTGMILPTLITAGWPLLVAFWLLCGAPPLAHMAYPGTQRGTKDDRQA